MRTKNIVFAVIFLFMTIVCVNANEIIEIRERMFLTHINEIYLNAGDYLGKTIKLEGIFKIEQYEKESVFFVLRYVPDGCCGGRGFAGFEVRTAANNLSRQIPANDSWVEAVGVLREYRAGLNKYLYLELSSLNVLNRRGAEFVTR